MTSSTKIFRPWTSVKNDFLKKPESSDCSDIIKASNSSVFTRVPELGYPVAEFAAAAAGDPMCWQNLPIAGFEDWSNLGLPMLPFHSSSSYAQSLSYLDPNYLNAALGEIYGSAKAGKLKQRPKKFRCPHCKVSFSNNGQLKGHVRIHTGERPFKCDAEKCGKSFTRNEELTRHKRIHTGLRPFPCDQCGKRFGRKDHLKKHIRTHYPPPKPVYYDPNGLLSLYPVLFGCNLNVQLEDAYSLPMPTTA